MIFGNKKKEAGTAVSATYKRVAIQSGRADLVTWLEIHQHQSEKQLIPQSAA